MAAAMMMQMPRDMAPTRMASAMLCSWTISFQRWYGVSLSITTNAMIKMSMPIRANTSAETMLASGTRFILFASGVMVIEAVHGTIGAGIVTDGSWNVFQLVDAIETPAMILREAGASENEKSISEIEFSEHRLFLRIPELNLHGRMIALRPPRAFETDGAPGDGDGRNQERQKGNSKKAENRDVALDQDGIGDGRMSGVHLRLDAQVIMTSGNARYDHGVFRAAFGPGAVAVRTVVVADFASEIPGLAGVLIDERVIQIDPGVRDVGGSGDLDI